MHTTALALLSYVLLWCGVSVLVALAWAGLSWCVGRRQYVQVLYVSKAGLYDPHARKEDGCGD